MKTDPKAGAMSAVGSASGAADGNPRNSNTGVVITNSAQNAATPGVVDWCSFTIPVGDDATAEVEAAGLARRLGDSSQALDHGAMGYTHGFRLPGSGLVLYNPSRPDMGVHVSLPSQALQFIPYEPRDLIAMVLADGGRFTRVDVAVDTHEVHISTVDAAIERGDLVSRATNQEKIQSYKSDGFTIYIGSRTSDRFTRIYNKQAEQGLAAAQPYSGPEQQALQDADQALQDARMAVLEANIAKQGAEQSRKDAKLSWLTARLGTDKGALELARERLKETKQAKQSTGAALLKARRMHLVEQQALQDAQQALQDARQQALQDANQAVQDERDGKIWTRAEVEFKGGQAQTAACHILQGVDLRSLVFSAIDFRDRSADSNTSRCPRLAWWEQWIGAVDRVSFAVVQTVVDTVERAYEWVRKQCAPTLAFLDDYFGKNPIWLYQMCDANKHRISGERRLILEAAA